MIELALLALLHRLMSWGLAPLIATRTVAADAAALHRFLSDPANQLRLAARAPRHAAVRVRPSASGRVLSVEILRGARTVLWATWILTAGRGSTEVDVAVQFETRGPATRLALALGGRRWLARRLDDALARLAQICARAAEDVAAAPAAAQCAGRTRRTRRTRVVRADDRARLRTR
ncbi:MAG: hypothetical protein QOG42_1681 [Solirubrobacteraceae bacterium]|nr:hypothetical protein [Solirubrobacteraceae bacterium]